jgi:hypothetical protein
MNVPPDFGGTEIEKGLDEDLAGGPIEAEGELGEHNVGPTERGAFPHGDHEAHAPGEVCPRCGTVIVAGQDVRRRADGRWVHEVCPLPGATGVGPTELPS